MSGVEQNFDRELGVSDIDDTELEMMCNTIRHVVQRDCDVSVSSIYVMGSFARGGAMNVASDIDIRVVANGFVPDETREACERTLKEEYGPKIVPSVCGYLDAHITMLEPPESEPHERVD